MQMTTKPIGLFSESPSARQVEVTFLGRLANYVRGLSMAELRTLVVSGQFNEIFPAIEDEVSPVAPRRFEDLKPFDYSDWARRNKVTE